MSAEFIQFIFPCKECLVRAACKEKPDNVAEKKVLFNDNSDPRCLAVPKLPLDVTYHKGVLECWAVLGSELMSALQKSEDPKLKKKLITTFQCNMFPLWVRWLICYVG